MLPATKITKFRINFAQQTSGLVLDCGCGTGAYQSYLKADKIIGLDFTPSQLENVDALKVCADAAHLPFQKDTFDTIWSCGVLQYLNGTLDEILMNWKKVVKPGGKIYILTPNGNSIIDKIKTCFGIRGWASQGPVVKLYSVKELKSFGSVSGEISFLPFLNRLLRSCPQLGHTLMLEIEINK